jgi:hypothetical protein
MQIVDSLVVTLALDHTKYTEGQKAALASFKSTREEAASTAKEMETRGTQAASFFGKISESVLGLAAAYVGLNAVKGAIVDTTNATAQLGRTAQITGADLKNLSAFMMAVARNGGDQNTAAQQVSGLVQSIASAKLGNVDPNLMRFLGFIGAGVNDDPLEILKKFSDFAEKNKANPSFVAQVGALGGITDQATLSELLKGRGGLEADLQRSEQLRIATEKDAQAARELQGSFASLEQAADGLKRSLVTDIAPGLANFFNALATDLSTHPKQTVALTGGGALLGTGIGGVLGATLGGALGSLLGPVGTAAGVAAGFAIGASLGGTAGAGIGGGAAIDLATLEDGGANSSSLGKALNTIRTLEKSGNGAVSNKGAVGTYQILPSTARQYGIGKGLSDDQLTAALKDPNVNRQVASIILSDLLKRYNGDMDAVAIAYHSGPGAANAYLARGRDPNVLGPEGKDYLAREQKMAGATVNINGPITVTTRATDVPTGTAQGIKQAINNSFATQANTGLQ